MLLMATIFMMVANVPLCLVNKVHAVCMNVNIQNTAAHQNDQVSLVLGLDIEITDKEVRYRCAEYVHDRVIGYSCQHMQF